MNSHEETQRANVELVRAGVEALNRGEVDRVHALAHLDIEVHDEVGGVGQSGTYHGYDAYREWAEQWLEAWGDLHNDVEHIEPVGQRHVVVDLTQSARGLGSGAPVERRMFWMFEIRDGRATRLHLYFDLAKARAAAERGEASG